MSEKEISITTCFENKFDCVQYRDGECILLINTVFRKPCPFYYPKKETLEQKLRRQKYAKKKVEG